MEEKKGEIIEAEKKNIKKEELDDTRSKSKNGTVAIVLASIALVLSGVSVFFSYHSYEKASTPLTILNSGVDGNSANFVEGSVADIVEK